jgi:hypothetical protein
VNYVVTLDGKTLCGRAKPTPHQFGEAMVRAIAEGELEQRECPLDHYFAKGLYGRRIYCDANTTVTTQRHKEQHFTFVLRGKGQIYNGEDVRHFEAPAFWITEPDTQRVVVCEEFTDWITVHANPDNLTDLDILEPILAEDTLSALKALELDKMKRID